MKQSVIPTMEDIRARADIPVFEVAGALEPMTGLVQVGSNDIYSVLKFADAVGSRALMVQYDYPEFDDFYVDPGAYPLEEMFEEECMDEVYEAIDDRNDEIDEYLDKEYDGEPFAASVFVSYDGTAYGMYVEDDALIEAFGETSDEFMVRLMLGEDDEEGED